MRLEVRKQLINSVPVVAVSIIPLGRGWGMGNGTSGCSYWLSNEEKDSIRFIADKGNDKVFVIERKEKQ